MRIHGFRVQVSNTWLHGIWVIAHNTVQLLHISTCMIIGYLDRTRRVPYNVHEKDQQRFLAIRP